MSALQEAMVADAASIIGDAPTQFTVTVEGRPTKFGPTGSTTVGPFWGRIEMGEVSEQRGSAPQGDTMTLDFVLLASPAYVGEPALPPLPPGTIKYGAIIEAEGKRYRVEIPYEDRSKVVIAQIVWLVQ